MKAVTFYKYGSPTVLNIEEIEKPIPRENEILIKVYAASINDWDIGLIAGKPYVIRIFNGLTKPKKSNIPGVDVAGKVKAVGSNVTKFKVGDDVFGDLSEDGFGVFAEYVCANENSVTIKPSDISFEDAAALPHAAMLVVQGLIDIGKIKTGDKVLINGAGGGVGTIGIQISKLFNIKSITGVDSSDKLDMLRSLGYDEVIDYKKTDFTSTGIRYDLILDVKSNRSIFKYAKALNKNGIYVTVGGSMNRIVQAMILRPIIKWFKNKNIIILGLKPNKDLEYIKEIYEKGKLKPVIDENIYSLDKIPEAITYFVAGIHKGKVIIKVQ